MGSSGASSGGVLDSAQQASDQTNSTTTPADLTDLALSIPGAGAYEFEWVIPYQSSATAQGVSARLKLTGAPAFSSLAYFIMAQSSTTGQSRVTANALDVAVSNSTVATAGNTYTIHIRGRIVATGSGLLVPQFNIGTGTGGTITVKGGTFAAWGLLSPA